MRTRYWNFDKYVPKSPEERAKSTRNPTGKGGDPTSHVVVDMVIITEDEYAEIERTGMFEGKPCRFQARCPDCGVVPSRYATWYGVCVYCDRVVPSIEKYKEEVQAYRIEVEARRIARNQMSKRRARNKHGRKVAVQKVKAKYAEKK